MGPGAYSPERAETITKTRTVNINLGTSPSRPAPRGDVDVGPGHYDDRNYEMSKSSKGFIIGEKRTEKIEYSQGPGAYDHEKADAVTKTKMATVTMGSSPSRATFVQKDSAIGPGQYDDGKRFNSDTKSFRIGEKRVEKI